MTKERKSTMRVGELHANFPRVPPARPLCHSSLTPPLSTSSTRAPPALDKINIECHRRLRPPSDLREQQRAYLVGHSHTDGFLRQQVRPLETQLSLP